MCALFTSETVELKVALLVNFSLYGLSEEYNNTIYLVGKVHGLWSNLCMLLFKLQKWFRTLARFSFWLWLHNAPSSSICARVSISPRADLVFICLVKQLGNHPQQSTKTSPFAVWLSPFVPFKFHSCSVRSTENLAIPLQQYWQTGGAPILVIFIALRRNVRYFSFHEFG